jgi:hypothetical protein
VISGEHPPPIGNLPGYSRITGWQHCRIPHFAAVSPLPFRGSAQCAVLVCNLGCDVETLFGPSLWICAGEFTQTLSWKSVPKLNRYVFSMSGCVARCEPCHPTAYVWLGATVDCQKRVALTEQAFERIKCGLRWLSCEPMLTPLHFERLDLFGRVVIGAATRSSRTEEFVPDFDWLADLHM